MIDEEVIRIINEQYERAKSILKEYASQHNEIRDLLVKKEVIYHDDVQAILGPRKWKSRTDEIIEINRKEEQHRKEIEARHAGSDDNDPGTPPPFNPKKN